jgi:hypothetical protein
MTANWINGPTITEALEHYPELRALLTLRRASWVFRAIEHNAIEHNAIEHNDELVGIAGSRSRQQYTDAIFIFDRTRICAARVLDDAYGGGCVWRTESSDLAEVVHELLGLPEPGAPGAPSLVRLSGLLWTP